ncbi:MAG: hypothetical protein LLG20_14340 [Acidobacteriales bacterium]|nr:hypothetical protein [Terriglobales bacterium]
MGGTSDTTFVLLTFILLVLTVWMVLGRFTRGLESNWPLVYYFMVVAYLKAFDGGLNPYLVYVAVVCGLFLRFEFMGGIILKAFRTVEMFTLVYIGLRTFSLVVGL